MVFLPLIVALAATAASHPALFHSKRDSFTGVATFNNFASQGSTVCGPKAGPNGVYGAAASDLSPNIGGGACSGSINLASCNGQSPGAGFTPPACPKTQCGTCYKVTNNGGMGTAIGGVGNSVTIQIIDSCPSTSALNFCKTNVPANQRCGAPGVNQLDIDQSAYMALTGQAFGSGPSLNIAIENADCSGSSSAGGSTPIVKAPEKVAVPASPSLNPASGPPGLSSLTPASGPPALSSVPSSPGAPAQSSAAPSSGDTEDCDEEL